MRDRAISKNFLMPWVSAESSAKFSPKSVSSIFGGHLEFLPRKEKHIYLGNLAFLHKQKKTILNRGT